MPLAAEPLPLSPGLVSPWCWQSCIAALSQETLQNPSSLNLECHSCEGCAYREGAEASDRERACVAESVRKGGDAWEEQGWQQGHVVDSNRSISWPPLNPADPSDS